VAKVQEYTDKPPENEWGGALPARAECASVAAKALKAAHENRLSSGKHHRCESGQKRA
jgi:hypothetical protein